MAKYGEFGHLFATALSANDSTRKEPLGAKRYEYDATNGGVKVYRYVAVASDTTVANGTVLTYTDAYHTTVTSDISDTGQNAAAGVGIGTGTAGYYVWIQSGGYHSALKTNGDDDIAKYATLIVDPTTDGVCDSVASGTAPTHRILGYAVAADDDTANTVAAYLTIDN
ncbi:MAG: hypothetical protein C4551_02530 [Bacillota bacterium]|nr:MAG: hypothetical protein C4551_02530 [Bacillota bacterium]